MVPTNEEKIMTALNMRLSTPAGSIRALDGRVRVPAFGSLDARHTVPGHLLGYA